MHTYTVWYLKSYTDRHQKRFEYIILTEGSHIWVFWLSNTLPITIRIILKDIANTLFHLSEKSVLSNVNNANECCFPQCVTLMHNNSDLNYYPNSIIYPLLMYLLPKLVCNLV